MNRRTALKGILGISGLGVASFVSYKYFLGGVNHSKGGLKAYYGLISELVDVIIPPTDTPGAKEAMVQNYVIDYMEECSSGKEYTNFLNGLKDVNEVSINTYNNTFAKCTAEQKIEILKTFESNIDTGSLISKISNKLQGRSFFSILKTLTIEGYCTSSLGATKHLVYLPVPGKYNAITKLETNQKAWATK